MTKPKTARSIWQRGRSTILMAAALAVGGLATTGATAQQSCPKTIKVATEGAFPPWNYVDANGKLAGWDIEITAALCKAIGADCPVAAQAWDGIIPGLQAGKFDAIIAQMSMTPKRMEQVDFTIKYKESSSRFVAKKGTVTEVTPAALKSKTIGVQRGAAQRTWLEEQGYANIRHYETTQAVELDLIAGRIDLLIQNTATSSLVFFKRPESKDFDFVGPEFKGGTLGAGQAIAIRKGDNTLRECFNTAIRAIRKSGEYDAISAKYVPFKLLTEDQ
jgi:arginine/ornithine transport system substrate-binding protein